MSGKVGYPFVPFPVELHPLWVGVSTHDMGLCLRLFLLTKGLAYAVHGKDWMGWMCRQMSIHGPERRNVRAALQRYYELGLIRVETSTVTVGFTPDFDVALTLDRRSTDVALTSHEHRTDVARVVQKDLSVENHSTPKSQIDKIEEIKEENTRASALPQVEAPGEFAERYRLAEALEQYIREQGPKQAGVTPKYLRRHTLELARWALLPTSRAEWGREPFELLKAVANGVLGGERGRREGYSFAFAAANPIPYLAAIRPVPREQEETSKPESPDDLVKNPYLGGICRRRDLEEYRIGHEYSKTPECRAEVEEAGKLLESIAARLREANACT
jgi:hypothetical protein